METSWLTPVDGCAVTIALVAGFLGLLYWYSVSAFSTLSRIGINHPKPLPFIGNVLLFKKGFWEGDRHLVKTYGPICGYYMGRRPMILLAEPEALKQVLQKDFGNFTNRMKLHLVQKPLSDSLLRLRDDDWKRVRSILTPSFSAAKMKEMCPLINQACDVLLENLQKFANSGESCDLQRCYSCFTMDIVASVAFGTQLNSQKDPDHPLVQNSKQFLELFTPFKPLTLLVLAFPSLVIPIAQRFPSKKQNQINQFFLKVIKGIIALRERQPPSERRRDFLQLMLDARDSVSHVTVDHFDVVNQADLNVPDVKDKDKSVPKMSTKKLSEDEILGQAFIFLIAGYETTSSLLSFTSYLLATHPDCQEKLLCEVDKFTQEHGVADYSTVQNLPYMEMVLNEALRMYPPAFRFAREASQDCTVMGQRIPAGSVVEIPIGYLQNDPRFWREPEKFNPERFTAEEKQKRHPFLFLPFGAGPRSCIGMRLAILKAKIALCRLLQRFRFETCELTQIPLQVSAMTTLRPKDGVYVTIIARHHTEEPALSSSAASD